MKYITTPLEDSVYKLYKKIGVEDPDHSVRDIAARLGISLFFRSKIFLSVEGVIYIDPFKSKEKQKEIFSHELSHVLHDVGVQLDMPEAFRQMQEARARNFALHFAVPTFMLLKLDMPKYRNQAVNMVANTFGVTYDFADERLQHYERQITGALFYEELFQCSESTEEYTPGEIDVYDDLPFHETPDFKELINDIKSKGATDEEIQNIISNIEYKISSPY